MLTGLEIFDPDRPFVMVVKASHQPATKEVKGWKGYISEHARPGAVDHREHIAFLNMWLKFVFCGSTVGPQPICNQWLKD
jgi:hypothetical protein